MHHDMLENVRTFQSNNRYTNFSNEIHRRNFPSKSLHGFKEAASMYSSMSSSNCEARYKDILITTYVFLYCSLIPDSVELASLL